MQKATIFACPEKCMKGAELKRLREAAGLSRLQLADKLYGLGWTIRRIRDYELSDSFCIDPTEMADLLKSLGATSL